LYTLLPDTWVHSFSCFVYNVVSLRCCCYEYGIWGLLLLFSIILLYMMPCGLYGQHTLMYNCFMCMNLYNLNYMFSKVLLMLLWRLGLWVSLHAYKLSLNCMFLFESKNSFVSDPIRSRKWWVSPIPIRYSAVVLFNQCRISILLCVDLIVTLLCVKHNLLNIDNFLTLQ